MRELCSRCGGRGYFEADPLGTPLQDTDFDTCEASTALPLSDLLKLQPVIPPPLSLVRGTAKVTRSPAGWRARLSRLLK